ncbi:MAG TPA: ABC transporter ATP-binding protein/permease [Candidatus Binatia bacterium]|nr:ABC transporter ATP-binding protein/permease [Candidatus Binatia bacterium]
MSDRTEQDESAVRRELLAAFWDAALGFWRKASGSHAWMLTVLVIGITVVNVGVQYRINVWHRTMFDALERKDASAVLVQSLIFLPLIAANVALAVAALHARMTTQRSWRAWLNGHVLDRWLAGGRYYQLNLVAGDHENPEYRVAEDLRVACDAPVDFAVGLLSASLSAITFIGVLWFIGGPLTIHLGGTAVTIPGFLVVAAVLYAVIASGSMVMIGRSFVGVSENKNQAEAEYRYALTRLRENGESIALLGGEDEERAGLDRSFKGVLEAWRHVLRQWMKTQVVSQTSAAFVPVVPLILCAPKYVAGGMSLGEVMQAASAFVTVQVAFNWLVDNYPRLADWTASARRLASLLVSLDRLERADVEDGTNRIARGECRDGAALDLRGLSVTLNDGSAVVSDAEAEIGPGEKVLVVGESGAGKSTLVRAISGLWPWGQGEIRVRSNARVSLMPQRPYVPLGTLRRAATYPTPPEEVDEELVRKTLADVGLDHFVDRLDEEGTRWEDILSGGEKQRLAFARILIHRPDIVVMDEATAALDPPTQERMMNLVLERLPESTVISVGHRAELEAFHTRKLVLEYHADGARLVRDETIRPAFRRSARVLSALLGREPRPRRAATPASA